MGRPVRHAAPVSGGTVFVTVGTTKFDALIAAVDDPRVADALVARGYGKLVMQASPKPLLCHLPLSIPVSTCGRRGGTCRFSDRAPLYPTRAPLYLMLQT